MTDQTRDTEGLGEARKAHPDTAGGVWEQALADPAFVASLEQGLADIKAGRVTPWSEVKAVLDTAGEPGEGRCSDSSCRATFPHYHDGYEGYIVRTAASERTDEPGG